MIGNGKVGAFTLAVVLAAAAQAATWHVAPEGTAQGDGSREKPFSVAGIPQEKVRPGDEVVFLDGVYKGALNVTTVGNEKGPIAYRAEHRHKAILDGKGKFPQIPQWLLDEWPLSRRGQ